MWVGTVWEYFFKILTVELSKVPCSCDRSNCYFYRLHDCSVATPRCFTDVYVNCIFPSTSKLLNSLPVKCFPWSCDNGFHTNQLSLYFLFFYLFSCNSMRCSGCSFYFILNLMEMKNISKKKNDYNEVSLF